MQATYLFLASQHQETARRDLSLNRADPFKVRQPDAPLTALGLSDRTLANSPGKRVGFSLLELLAVIAIIGFLSTLLVPRLSTSADTAKEKTCFHHRAQINAAVEIFSVKNGSFPSTLADLDTPDVFPDGIPTCPVSGVAYTLNATTHRVQGHLGGGKTGGHP